MIGYSAFMEVSRLSSLSSCYARDADAGNQQVYRRRFILWIKSRLSTGSEVSFSSMPSFPSLSSYSFKLVVSQRSLTKDQWRIWCGQIQIQIKKNSRFHLGRLSLHLAQQALLHGLYTDTPRIRSTVVRVIRSVRK